MKLRRFDHTDVDVSEIGFGAWAIGADWGKVDDSQSEATLNEALDRGITFIDTADVYGDGRSERLIGKVLADRKGPRPFVATKAGAPLRSLGPAGYDRAHLLPSIERSLSNLRTDCLDLLQLHCPPSAVYYAPEVFEALDRIVKDGKIRNYGVSVERVEDAIKAIEFPGVKSVQIIFNMFRRRPAELFFKLAEERNVAIIVRVPLASGLLTGKFKRDTHFEASDHREYNRHGEVLRRRRDLFGCALRGRNCRGRGDPVAAAAGHDDGPVRAPLDPDVPRGDDRHSRRQDAGAGPRQCRGERSAADRQGDHGEAAGPLRPADQAVRPPALVGRAGSRRGVDFGSACRVPRFCLI